MGKRGAVLVAVAAISLVGTPAIASPPGNIHGWRQMGHTTVSAAVGNEGVTTVRPRAGQPFLQYRGADTIPQVLKDQGWGHVGDPDSTRGYIFDVYQNTRDVPAPNKMFLVTTPAGQTFTYEHTLLPEEPAANANSEVAVTPDGQWMVAGALGDLTSLFVFPTPLLNPRVKPGPLPLAAHVLLDHPVRNVQGCDFVTETKLLCGTSDPNNDLYPTNFQLLQITLAHPLRGTDTRAHVTSLGQVPLVSTCIGSFVTEGVDYSDGLLTVEVNPPTPCNTITDVYTFRAS
jgi:hypothetical protein